MLIREVFNVSDNSFVGNFFLDLFPRDGKYSHASAYPVIDGFYKEGKWIHPGTCLFIGISLVIRCFKKC